MKSTRWLAAFALSLSGIAGVTTGCGDSGGTGGTGGTGTTVSSSTGSKVPSATNIASTGMTGNHSFETAVPVDVNPTENTTGTLVDTDTPDYYSFTGTAGERIVIIVNAQSLAQTDGDDDTVVDPVVTIFNSAKTQIAQDDDAWPRNGRDAQVFTTLPADGTYYYAVQDCNSAFPGASCAPAASVTTFDYESFIADVDKLNFPEVNEGTADNNTNATPVSVAYAIPSGGTAGNYGIYHIDGGFSSGTDVDYFGFTPKPDTVIDATARPRAEFWVQPIGANNGDGSTSNVIISVEDGSGNVLARADQADYTDGDNATNGPINLSVPVTLDAPYFLKISPSGSATSPVSDFYFIEHFVGTFYYGQHELADVTNNLPVTPEELTTPATVTSASFFVDGDIAPAGTDVDWYSMTLPGGLTKVSLFCDAQRQGSGLRNAKFGLYTMGGTNKLGEFTEKATEIGGLFGNNAITLPASTTTLLLKAEAGSQDPTVTGAFYHCTVSAIP